MFYNTTWSTDSDTWNTTSEIWSIVDNGTFTTNTSVGVYNTSMKAYVDAQDFGGGNIFDQWLNTTSNVTHYNLSLTGNLSVGDKVGIGTTNPEEKLHVNGSLLLDSDNVAIILRETDTTTQRNKILTDGWGLYIDSALNADAEYNNIMFRTEETDSQESPTERMRITNSGNVGINTTAPNSTLHVVGNLTATDTIWWNNINVSAYNFCL
jgi:hypothetical protein